MKAKRYYMERIFFTLVTLMLSGILFSCSEEGPEDKYIAPVLSVSGTNNLGRTSAIVHGQFDGKLSRVKEYGVKYSTSSVFPEDKTGYITYSGTPSAGSFSTQLTHLEANTQYYFRLFAITGGIEVTSDIGSFTTASISKPSFDDIVVESISENSAVIRFRISDVGDEYLIEQGVSYRKKTNSATEEAFVSYATDSVSDSAQREFVAVLYNLSAETTYEIRPYAKNASDASGENGMVEGFGNVQTFTTGEQKSPVVVMYDISSGNIGISSVVVSGIVTSAQGSNGVLDEVGFCYSENRQEPTWQDNVQVIEGKELNTVYTHTITGLKGNTTYFVRMYAKNTVDGSVRYGYGETKTFTTKQLSTPIFDAFTNVVAETQQITLTANLSNYDEDACIEKGFYWSTSITECTLDKASKLGNSMKVTQGGRSFTATITGLSAGVLYYIGAYAVYKSGQEELTGYSDPYAVSTVNFTSVTLDVPLITDVTSFGAKATGVVRDLGNGTIKKQGFVISSRSHEPTIDSNDLQAEGDDNFQCVFTGLIPEQTYYIRSYIICQFGDNAASNTTVYSSASSFTTASLSLDTPDCNSSGNTSESIVFKYGSDLNMDLIKECGVVYSTKALEAKEMENSMKATADSSDSRRFIVSLEGLEPEVTYYYYIYTIFESGTTVYNGRYEFVNETESRPGASDNDSPTKRD